MVYVHQYTFGVRPEKMDLWIPHAHNNLAVMARQPGLMSMRIFRWRQQPDWFFSVRVWRSKADSDRALASPEVQLVTRTNPAYGLSEGYAGSQREFELSDHVFGMRGIAGFLPEGGFAHHLIVHVPPENIAAWTPYRRICASVMARQPGVAAYEVARDLADPTRFLVLRTYTDEHAARIMKGGQTPYAPTKEVEYITQIARDRDFYRGADPVVYTDCDLFAGVLGLEGEALYAAFMASLVAV